MIFQLSGKAQIRTQGCVTPKPILVIILPYPYHCDVCRDHSSLATVEETEAREGR